MKLVMILFLAPVLFGMTRAAVITKTVEYKDGPTTLEGFVAYDDSFQGRRPGVLVVH